MKNVLMKAAGMALLIAGIGGSLWAVPVPEIDPASGINAIALLAGAVLMIRGRKR
jgi:hypothetical protein